jgi:hypothetical protein
MSPKWPHGTRTGYGRRKCRCSDCRAWNTTAKIQQRKRRHARLMDDSTLAPHGVYNTANNWGCRCDLCVATIRAYFAGRRAASTDAAERRAAPETPSLDDMKGMSVMQRVARIKPFGREWLNDPVQ